MLNEELEKYFPLLIICIIEKFWSTSNEYYFYPLSMIMYFLNIHISTLLSTSLIIHPNINNYLIIHLCIIHLFNLTFIKLFNLYSGI